MPCVAFSQGISNMWLSGYRSGFSGFGGSNINFYSGFADTNYVYRQMNINDCHANISDSLGNLLFYTNGIYIANSNNDTMLNGSGLNPGPYTTQHLTDGLTLKQGNLILPQPENANLYYLFHETFFFDSLVNDERVKEIYYSVIDMSLDGGLGAVTQKNIVLLSDTLTIGAITACKHANGRDWWIVFHRSKGRRYYKYLLTPVGLQGPYAQDIGYSLALNDWIWQSCFSPDGTKFSSVMARDTIDVMEFDRCSGLFSNSITLCIKDSAAGRGVAFSPSSEVLYVSSMNYLYQYDLLNIPIDSGRTIITTFDGYAEPAQPFYTAFFLSQLANDGKIYINNGNTTQSFTVINSPNNVGFSCDVLQHSFALPTYNAFTIPNFPNYFLGREQGSVCDSLSISRHDDYENSQNESARYLRPLEVVTDERGEYISSELFIYVEEKTFHYCQNRMKKISNDCNDSEDIQVFPKEVQDKTILLQGCRWRNFK